MARRWTIAAATGALALLMGVSPAAATPGDLDDTFSDDGRAISDTAPGVAEGAEDVVVQDDGKVVVAGWAGSQMLVARYAHDGTLDPTFSGDGVVRFGFPGTGLEHAHAVGLDSTGRIVVAGEANGRMGVARLTTDGELDPAFGGDGRSTFLGSGPDGWANDLVVDAVDRVVVVGRLRVPHHPATGPTDTAMLVGRLGADGVADPSFSGDGLLVINASRRADTLESVDLTSDGRIVAAGRKGGAPNQRGSWDLALRLWPGGGRDQSFGFRGFANLYIGVSTQRVDDIDVDADGRLLVAGQGDGGIALARLDVNGDYDPSFDGEGVRRQDTFPGGTEWANAIQEDADGKILVAGTIRGGGNEAAVVFRYTESGQPDHSFSANGWLALDLTPGDDRGTGVALAPDGKVVVSAAVPNRIAAARILSP